MSMEDVVLVARVREEIRDGALRVDAADIRRHIEVVQAGKQSHLMGDDIHLNAPKTEATAQNSDPMAASAVYPNVEAGIAEMTGAVLPPGLQHRCTKEGGTSKELPVESPGVELPDAVESTLQDCLKKNVATSAVQTGGTRKLEVALLKAAASPLAKAAFAENHSLRAMAGQEAEEKTNAETMRRLEVEAAKECANAEEKARKVQEEAAHARERAFAEAKKAAVEARKAEAKVKYEAESRAKVEAAANANEEVKIKAAEEAKTATAKAELGAKQTAEKERLEIETKTKAEAAKAKAEDGRKRVEAFVAKAELRAMEQIERQRAADKAARAATAASGTMAPAQVASGGSWFSNITSVAASAIPAEGPTTPTSTSLWNSDPWSKRPVKNAPSPSTDLGPLCPGVSGIPIQHPLTTSSAPRGSAPTHSTTSITATTSSTSVVSSLPTLVSQERNSNNDKPDGKAGDRRGNPATAALPARVVADIPHEAKSETVMAIANKPIPSQTTNASKTCDIIGVTAAPNALGDKYVSLAPTPWAYRSLRAQETAPAEVVADLKPIKDPTSAPLLKPCQPGLFTGSLPLPTPRQPGLVPGGFPLPPPRSFGLVPGDFPSQTPRQSHLFLRKIPPETDAAVTKEHAPSLGSVASAPAKRNGEPETPNVPDAKNAGETSAQTMVLFAVGVKPDGAAAEPIPQAQFT
ncbi:hypothetical protein EDB92DRAFT_1539677 [Lactarius akahatsu]|uniref:Uncharacterized protein n=1 Tax=Lactarius akahatsu TaxID=416441 RepID=A0AAD4LNI7_9AGAM|nr:hypothetical protein EDB92DRAFT_1539677 [Lactarius akahatsu]